MNYEFEGKTEKEAIEKAAAELGLERDQFDVEIIEAQKKSLFKAGYVKIRVTPVNDTTVSKVNENSYEKTSAKAVTNPLAQAQAELGKAVTKEAQIQSTLDMVAEQRVQTVKTADSIKNAFELYNLNNYLALLDQRKEKLLQELTSAHLETEEKRQKMKEAMLKVKALEKLKETRQNDWKLENARREAVELDDIVNSRQARK